MVSFQTIVLFLHDTIGNTKRELKPERMPNLSSV